ncbi:NADPH oxidase family protein [Phanerochaete sordida]|uniref:NADPH oxidase family protein n=1 Tax=Phanerochaete sordida TaxID=48140 RepID=A0A9P3G8I5_9APHY|nr:NADPH oxidase family protein [Phanerochaete sordida]
MSEVTSQPLPPAVLEYIYERERWARISMFRMWFLDTGVIGFATVINVVSVMWAWKQRRSLRRRSSNTSTNRSTVDTSPGGGGRISLRRLPAAALALIRIPAFRWRIPLVNMTLLELFLTLNYLAALLILDVVYSQHRQYGSIQAHAANMACSQFPLIVALAMKNNAIEYLTGISHEKLNLMHRIISRLILIQIWVHFIAIVAGHAPIWTETWRFCGFIAGMSFSILTVLSIKPIRQRFYEFFWITHVIFVLLFLVAATIHTSGPLGFPYDNFIWPCFVIWGQDRICRYLRYVLLTSFQAPSKAPARVEILSDDTLRITVRRTFYLPTFTGRGAFARGAGWKAGQHMFLAFPTIGPLESHPFTIAAFSEPLDAPAPGETTVDDRERELMWIVRKRQGLTGRLYDHVAAEGGACDIHLFMDGPYGAPPDITVFETCVFIAGGSGVAYTIPRMRDILLEARKGAAFARRVVFIWAVRHTAHINWIVHDLQKAVASCPPDVELSIQVYVTSSDKPKLSHASTLSCVPTLADNHDSPASTTPVAFGEITTERRPPPPYSSEKDASEKEKDLERGSDSSHAGSVDCELKGVDVRFGRPDVQNLLKEIVTAARGTVSVDISGPELLVAATRSALASEWAGPLAVLRGGASVQLNVEDFTM